MSAAAWRLAVACVGSALVMYGLSLVLPGQAGVWLRHVAPSLAFAGALALVVGALLHAVDTCVAERSEFTGGGRRKRSPSALAAYRLFGMRVGALKRTVVSNFGITERVRNWLKGQR